jgi:hypothetical protein
MWLVITLNLIYACFMCHTILYPIHVNFMQIYIFECLKCNDECFLVNMLSLKKPEVPVLLVLPDKNWMVRFTKPDYQVLTNLAYVSPILFVMILLSCASNNSCSHTQIIAHIRCIHMGGALLDFLEKCVKWHL